MIRLNGLRAEIAALLSSATPAARSDRIRAICETVEALQLQNIFAAWMNARFGDPALTGLTDADLDEVLAYVRSMAGNDILPRRPSG